MKHLPGKVIISSYEQKRKKAFFLKHHIVRMQNFSGAVQCHEVFDPFIRKLFSEIFSFREDNAFLYGFFFAE